MDSKAEDPNSKDSSVPGQEPIPPELHSFSQGGLFECCSFCDGNLGGESIYEIQKVYRGGEVVFEMASCGSCGERQCREISRESMEALRTFLHSQFKPSRGILFCHFCGCPKPSRPGYTIIGACKGSVLLFPAVVLCHGCAERLQSRLSQKTRETQEGFIRDSFPGVPANLSFYPTLGGVH